MGRRVGDGSPAVRPEVWEERHSQRTADGKALICGGLDNAEKLFRAAYPDCTVAGAEQQFCAWLIDQYGGQLPPTGERVELPSLRAMFTAASRVSRETLERAKAIVADGITVTSQAKLRKDQHAKNAALKHNPVAGAFGGAPDAEGASLRAGGGGVSRDKRKWTAPPRQNVPLAAATAAPSRSAVDRLREMAPGPSRARQAVVILLKNIESTARSTALDEGIAQADDGALNAAIDKGLPAPLPDDRQLTDLLEGAGLLETLAPREVLQVKEALLAEVTAPAADKRALAAMQAKLAAQAQFAAQVQRVGPGGHREHAEKLMRRSGLETADFVELNAQQLEAVVRASLRGRPEAADEAVIEALSEGISDAVGARVAAEIRTHARTELKGLIEQLSACQEPTKLAELTAAINASAPAPRSRTLARLDISEEDGAAVTTGQVAAALDGAIAGYQRALDDLPEVTEGIEAFIDDAPWAAKAVADKYGIRLSKQGGMRADEAAMSVVERGFHQARSKARFLRATWDLTVAAVAGGFAGEVKELFEGAGFFSQKAADFFFGVAHGAAPELLEVIGRAVQD